MPSLPRVGTKHLVHLAHGGEHTVGPAFDTVFMPTYYPDPVRRGEVTIDGVNSPSSRRVRPIRAPMTGTRPDQTLRRVQLHQYGRTTRVGHRHDGARATPLRSIRLGRRLSKMTQKERRSPCTVTVPTRTTRSKEGALATSTTTKSTQPSSGIATATVAPCTCGRKTALGGSNTTVQSRASRINRQKGYVLHRGKNRVYHR